MANLKQTAAKIEQRTSAKLARGTVTLELPVYDGQYAARFGVLDEASIEALTTLQVKMMNATEANVHEALEAAAQVIADASRRIVARSEKGGEYEPLEHDDGRPVLFDQEFAEALDLEAAPGYELDSMAGVVLACWVVEDAENERALSALDLVAFAEKLGNWMQNTRAPVEGEVVEGPLGGPKSSG